MLLFISKPPPYGISKIRTCDRHIQSLIRYPLGHGILYKNAQKETMVFYKDYITKSYTSME